jgi:hypothetical protein
MTTQYKVLMSAARQHREAALRLPHAASVHVAKAEALEAKAQEYK